jgi:ATP-dependent DNA helicase HFM1/MER3
MRAAPPGQWDSFSRGWDATCEATKLVLIDEVHMLNEDRGATLEACVARLRMRMPSTRLIAASATISNPLDLSEWLGVSSPLIFGEEFRPVPLQTIVQTYPRNQGGKDNEFLFDKRLTHHLGGIIQQHSGGRPTLVFCATRKGAQEAAQTLAGESQQLFRRQSADHSERLARLRQASAGIENAELRACVVSGVGFHSAGLQNKDRQAVERLFKASDLLVVCTTTTLSQGVNLPAHLVVVKSTLQWRGAGTGYCEYAPNMLRQMIGRAGRPQFDTHGKAVIMTAQENGQKYRALADSQEIIESQMAPRLCDAINSEIAGGLIHDVGDLMLWINKLYLSVRFRKRYRHTTKASCPCVFNRQNILLCSSGFSMANPRLLQGWIQSAMLRLSGLTSTTATAAFDVRAKETSTRCCRSSACNLCASWLSTR